ncbi:MAG: hypothetical protein ACLSH8_12465 [Zhenhengia sp.]|uniref:hypothetical protein n=1 Tax=Zhenhengia sp. TaxID=2944208 RepID=UPI003991CDD7
MKHNTHENILQELINRGLTAEEIQACYERYVWHVNYYEPKLKQLEGELKRYKDRFGLIEELEIPKIGDLVKMKNSIGEYMEFRVLEIQKSKDDICILGIRSDGGVWCDTLENIITVK